MPVILGSSRHFVALSFAGLCTVSGCGNLLGLGGYSVADDSGGAGGGMQNVAGENVGGSVAGRAGAEIGEGGTGGVLDESAGSAGEAGALDSGGTGGVGGTGATSGSSGSAGSGGAPALCPGGCDDSNDCTTDSCQSGSCAHAPLSIGTACGVSRSCDAQALCVRCRDTAPATGQDLGCSLTAPICLGTGLDAACAGCSSASDCSDGNECTTETCNAGKCVFATVAAGTACGTGVCNGTASAEKCVTCADTSPSGTSDAGCSSAKPVCDPSGTPTCYECNTAGDCATDNVSCTVETCTNHACSHVATDNLCSASGDACNPNKCDAAVPGGCKQVDISAPTSIISTAVDGGNGGFEAVTLEPAPNPDMNVTADGWSEIGDYYIIYRCGSGGCKGVNGSTYPQSPSSVGGSTIAWLGNGGVIELYRAITFPVGTTKVRLLVDTNFQTKDKTSANQDFFEVRVLNSVQAQVGTPLFSSSNGAAETQTGTARAWTKDKIDVTRDLSALAGKPGYISFWSSVDATLTTDFFFDNVRLIATVCK